jgi:hypothetical protein
VSRFLLTKDKPLDRLPLYPMLDGSSTALVWDSYHRTVDSVKGARIFRMFGPLNGGIRSGDALASPGRGKALGATQVHPAPSALPGGIAGRKRECDVKHLR